MTMTENIVVTFKQAYTSNTHHLNVHPQWSCSEFIQRMTPALAALFQLTELEIVESGHPDAEEAPAFEPMIDITIEDKMGNNLGDVVFYVRAPRRHQNEHSTINSSSDNTIHDDDCCICMENNGSTMDTWFGCTHELCHRCYSRCLDTHHTTCPICRQNLNRRIVIDYDRLVEEVVFSQYPSRQNLNWRIDREPDRMMAAEPLSSRSPNLMT